MYIYVFSPSISITWTRSLGHVHVHMGHIDLSLQCPISNSGRVRMNRQNGASLQHGVGPREEILPSSARSHALTLTNHKNVTMRRFYCVLGGCKGARNRKWFTIGNYSLKCIVAACGAWQGCFEHLWIVSFDARLQIAWKRRQAKEEQFWPPGNWKATVLFAICAVHVSVRFFFSQIRTAAKFFFGNVQWCFSTLQHTYDVPVTWTRVPILFNFIRFRQYLFWLSAGKHPTSNMTLAARASNSAWPFWSLALPTPHM